MFLDRFKKNYYSENGEDGIIIEILKRLKIYEKKNKWCCEFGAWDGKHGSNTYNLVLKYNFKAVYIEGNKERFKLLKKLCKKNSRISAFNKFISHKKKSKNCLENVLQKTKIKKKFEILSIDIDSYDLEVWKTLKKYQPIIVVIEINSEIKPGIFQTHSKTTTGNSFSSTINLAKKKGYILIAHTGNCIFIKKKYLEKIKIPKFLVQYPEKLFDWKWIKTKDNNFKKFIKLTTPDYILNYLKKYKNLLQT